MTTGMLIHVAQMCGKPGETIASKTPIATPNGEGIVERRAHQPAGTISKDIQAEPETCEPRNNTPE
jgi:hypothetical protein